MSDQFSNAWHEWRRVNGALSADPEKYGNEGQEALWDQLDRSIDQVLTAPASNEWELQEKFQLFQSQVLDADGVNGRRADRREHVWFASLMADSLAAAGRA